MESRGDDGWRREKDIAREYREKYGVHSFQTIYFSILEKSFLIPFDKTNEGPLQNKNKERTKENGKIIFYVFCQNKRNGDPKTSLRFLVRSSLDRSGDQTMILVTNKSYSSKLH